MTRSARVFRYGEGEEDFICVVVMRLVVVMVIRKSVKIVRLYTFSREEDLFDCS